MKRSGFTLIDFLVAIAILFPVLAQAECAAKGAVDVGPQPWDSRPNADRGRQVHRQASDRMLAQHGFEALRRSCPSFANAPSNGGGDDACGRKAIKRHADGRAEKVTDKRFRAPQPTFAAGILSGSGDPAPSTTLAPNKPLPDASKPAPDQLDTMLKQDHDAGRK